MAATFRCPICKKQVKFSDPNRPFCSDRCRIQDLANWADEKYVISTPANLSEMEDPDEPDWGKGSIQ